MNGTRTVLVAACLGALSLPAYAHFKLLSPSSRSEQDGLGGPQKSAPCGITDDPTKPDQSVPTNAVSTLKAGSTVTISINETITHPGHYRVVLAQDIASLPADPAVMTKPGFACGSTMIDANPQMPLLADGLFVHTSSFGGKTQTAQVQLPAGMTCTNCVLQVVQFMSDHGLNNPGGCFYHHCAIVNVTADGPMDAGVTGGDDAGTTPAPETSGCCDTNGRNASGAIGLAAIVGMLVFRRRRAQRVSGRVG